MNIICRYFGHRIEHVAHTETGIIARCDRCGEILKLKEDEKTVIAEKRGGKWTT